MPRTRDQQREYMREYRKLKRAAKLGIDSAHVTVPGPGKRTVAEAVVQELARMPASSGFPALQETARVLAECLDDPLERRHHPTAAGQLRMLLAEVRSAQVSDAAKSSLRSIRGELAG